MKAGSNQDGWFEIQVRSPCRSLCFRRCFLACLQNEPKACAYHNLKFILGRVEGS